MKKQDFGQVVRDYPLRVWSVDDLLREIPLKSASPQIIDLGCGDGRGVDRIRSVYPEAQYLVIDIETSDERKSRTRTDAEFVAFDGVNIPREDSSFDMVYCVQVFEHVRHPDKLVTDILRVLKPGGYFVVSLSGIEPYHSHSIFNSTPYGWFTVLSDNGFLIKTMRAGADGHSLLMRNFAFRTGDKDQFAKYDRALNEGTGEFFGKILNLDVGDLQKKRLLLDYAGHIVFSSQKPLPD